MSTIGRGGGASPRAGALRGVVGGAVVCGGSVSVAFVCGRLLVARSRGERSTRFAGSYAARGAARGSGATVCRGARRRGEPPSPAARIAPVIAIPSEAASPRIVSSMPEATPAFSTGTALRTAAVSGVVRPASTAMITSPGTSWTNVAVRPTGPLRPNPAGPAGPTAGRARRAGPAGQARRAGQPDKPDESGQPDEPDEPGQPDEPDRQRAGRTPRRSRPLQPHPAGSSSFLESRSMAGGEAPGGSSSSRVRRRR